MVELTDEQLKQVEQSVLDRFAALCLRQGWRYTLIGGTLLGAVRHKGFIPWDDDIDVAMPRTDYDKLVAYCRENKPPFGYVFHETDKTWTSLAGKIYDEDTVIVDTVVNRFDSKCGVFVDVFPIDGMGNSKEEAEKTMKKSRFNRELLNAISWKKFSKSKTHGWIYEPFRFAFYLLSRCANPQKTIRKIEKTFRKYDFETSAYVGIVCGSYRNREIFPRSVYDKYAALPFEDTEYAAIEQATTYLSQIYGNYMALPPEEKRVSHHTFTAYRLEEADKNNEI